jgi:hypothetical protein
LQPTRLGGKAVGGEVRAHAAEVEDAFLQAAGLDPLAHG